jgi:hypothetical protein
MIVEIVFLYSVLMQFEGVIHYSNYFFSRTNLIGEYIGHILSSKDIIDKYIKTKDRATLTNLRFVLLNYYSLLLTFLG